MTILHNTSPKRRHRIKSHEYKKTKSSVPLLTSTPRKSKRTTHPEDAHIVTPLKPSSILSNSAKLEFSNVGSSNSSIPENVRKVYKIINAKTGRIGGNGAGGPIYGELTMHSMQKMVELMKEYSEFSSESRFIDIGSGLGKPNLYVAQNPGVSFSFGIEVEKVRNSLGLHNLLHILREADQESDIGTNCILKHGNILDATTLDPFTHVYMFDIGFPPTLFRALAEKFNRSQSPYLICYHGTRLIIDRYGFDVELLTQIPTKMHGSSEGHTGYIYKRRTYHNQGNIIKRESLLPMIVENDDDENNSSILCDPLFKEAWDIVKKGRQALTEEVSNTLKVELECGRPKRIAKKPILFF